MKSIPVPLSGWKTSGATGLSVGKTPSWNSHVELTPVLGMAAPKVTPTLLPIPA